MMNNIQLAVLLVTYYIVCTLFSFLINWLFLKFSFTLGTRNVAAVNQVRWSTNVKPAIGGISFFIIFLVSISVVGALPRADATFFDKQLIGIIASACLGFLIGLADDAYNTNPLAKFIAQLTCAFILIISDVFIPVTGHHGVDYAITVTWVVGLMNSINMLDNMDAITATTSICIISGIILIVWLSGLSDTPHYLIMLTGVLGALSGFLYFNWNPSRLYMGDTGSQFLGVFLASTSMMFIWGFKNEASPEFLQLKQFVVPMLFFIVPLIDTITVTFRRLLRKQSPFIGGKDHITHHLAYLGLSDRQVALVLLGVSLLSIPISLLYVMDIIEWNFQATLGAFVYFFTVFFIFQYLYNKGKARQANSVYLKPQV
ncbi:MAG: undecaprenyl/decaprenyl-phosphate alpha-N-acetylglucosaminyl 1-phosphate transferase [Chitinophagales bacterium]|nr:undecaprenyl/decaprenyl-phosphate alpha-N-acetylglucosaminyl 1-phosphate transferase [Chitinophagales bacterium]MDW8417909.1 MraY family glycosyltransferase [Chitinophagales bacterium]